MVVRSSSLSSSPWVVVALPSTSLQWWFASALSLRWWFALTPLWRRLRLHPLQLGVRPFLPSAGSSPPPPFLVGSETTLSPPLPFAGSSSLLPPPPFPSTAPLCTPLRRSLRPAFGWGDGSVGGVLGCWDWCFVRWFGKREKSRHEKMKTKNQQRKTLKIQKRENQDMKK